MVIKIVKGECIEGKYNDCCTIAIDSAKVYQYDISMDHDVVPHFLEVVVGLEKCSP